MKVKKSARVVSIEMRRMSGFADASGEALPHAGIAKANAQISDAMIRREVPVDVWFMVLSTF